MIYLRTPVLLDLVPYTDIVARNNETDSFYRTKLLTLESIAT